MRRGGDSTEILGRLRNFARLSSPAARRVAAMAVDALVVLESFVIALLFRFDGSVPEEFWNSFWPFSVLAAAVFVALLYESGVYRSVLRYTGVYQGVRVASATAIAAGLLFVTDFGLGPEGIGLLDQNPVPLSVVLVGALAAYVQLVAVRLYPRVFYELSLREVGQRKRALIVGAGEAGVALARQLWRTSDADLAPVGFMDDDEQLRGKQIEGIPVFGATPDIGRIVEERGIDQILIAIPSATSEQMDRIWGECVKTEAEVKVVPKLSEFLGQEIVRLRELQIQDLLGRQPVEIDLDALAEFINSKRILITGAGGSIGSELARQISRFGPARLVLLDRDESALYYLNEELGREGFSGAELVVGDATNWERVRALFSRLRPHVVFHAAAYKHVPLMELHVSEAVSNNVGGTLCAARAAGEFGAEKFINVSTDKAVNPANVMGATKRLSEMLVRAAAEEYSETLYASVRFGNVLGSRGSVVPTFRRQIEAGGPVTVTHPEMTRYFMIIPEAVSLILQAGAMADSYGTYVLEMGRPVKIVDLAQKMIEVMGARGVKMLYTGLRPGERLHETLSEESEQRAATDHPMVFRLVPKNPPSADLLEAAEEMTFFARQGDDEKVLKLLRHAVPNYPAIESGAMPEAL
ncbi:MAG: polysaccharide biosynthesis protein [Actinomycetota bacterium]|nr:polysaccharide biosynthesis protein [Actinomycetota bacterium]